MHQVVGSEPHRNESNSINSAELTLAASTAAHQAKDFALRCAQSACDDAGALFIQGLHLDDEVGSGTLERHRPRSIGSRPAMAMLHICCLSVRTIAMGCLHLNEGARLH